LSPDLAVYKLDLKKKKITLFVCNWPQTSSLTAAMSSIHTFLVENAKFPFPVLDGKLSNSTTDISPVDVGYLETEWKAKRAVRDDELVEKLCHALEGSLGNAPLAEQARDYLLAKFSPRIQFSGLGQEDEDWSTNPNEAHVSLSGVHYLKPSNFELTLR
jgi:hypothetical protein